MCPRPISVGIDTFYGLVPGEEREAIGEGQMRGVRCVNAVVGTECDSHHRWATWSKTIVESSAKLHCNRKDCELLRNGVYLNLFHVVMSHIRRDMSFLRTENQEATAGNSMARGEHATRCEGRTGVDDDTPPRRSRWKKDTTCGTYHPLSCFVCMDPDQDAGRGAYVLLSGQRQHDPYALTMGYLMSERKSCFDDMGVCVGA
ncbi:hypothetical protein DFJ77DRAFT_98153 [Powellomyces hirtus]|nr:hypothetical protein DFJ77DRAFT_98153 [Powellomyces hirtus]